MAPDDNERNNMELFTADDVRVQRARNVTGTILPALREKPPNLLAWWRVIRKRRWTVLSAFARPVHHRPRRFHL